MGQSIILALPFFSFLIFTMHLSKNPGYVYLLCMITSSLRAVILSSQKLRWECGSSSVEA